jgi:hypothetical protein
MRVIVCGGRTYGDIMRVRDVLNEVHAEFVIREIVTGGATGADTLAYGWALRREITAIVVPAEWKKFGRKAGPLRNDRIIREWGGGLCVAFPGGDGTKDMRRKCEAAGIPVRQVEPQ